MYLAMAYFSLPSSVDPVVLLPPELVLQGVAPLQVGAAGATEEKI